MPKAVTTPSERTAAPEMARRTTEQKLIKFLPDSDLSCRADGTIGAKIDVLPSSVVFVTDDCFTAVNALMVASVCSAAEIGVV
jgi:hypothetical protein